MAQQDLKKMNIWQAKLIILKQNLCTLNKLKKQAVKLKSVKKLIRIEAKSYDEAKEKLCSCDGYAEIMYDCPTPLTSLQINALRSCPSFVKFTPCFNALSEQSDEKRKLMTDEQLFEAFFERKKGRLPDDDEKEAFFKAVRKEELL